MFTNLNKVDFREDVTLDLDFDNYHAFVTKGYGVFSQNNFETIRDYHIGFLDQRE